MSHQALISAFPRTILSLVTFEGITMIFTVDAKIRYAVLTMAPSCPKVVNKNHMSRYEVQPNGEELGLTPQEEPRFRHCFYLPLCDLGQVTEPL